MPKKKLLISFSGGQTSAYMTYKILNDPSFVEEYEFIIVFANTGKEHEGTLEFVRDCEGPFGQKVHWIGSRHLDDNGNRYSPKGWKVGFNTVSFDTASRNGEPFEEMISVLGVPCSEAPFCSDQLKRKPINAFMKSIGWKGFYKAIGIRLDEIDRVNPNYKKERIIYPLISEFRADQKVVDSFFGKSLVKLSIPPNMGNCDACWKKSFKTLVQIAKDKPGTFDWWEAMARKYSENNRTGGPTNFYREGKSVADIFKMKDISEQQLSLFDALHVPDCSESCEVF